MSTASRRNHKRRQQIRHFSDLPLVMDELGPELYPFGQWLLAQGHHPLQLTGPYEVMRWREGNEVRSVYRNKRYEVTWTKEAAATFRSFKQTTVQ